MKMRAGLRVTSFLIAGVSTSFGLACGGLEAVGQEVTTSRVIAIQAGSDGEAAPIIVATEGVGGGPFTFSMSGAGMVGGPAFMPNDDLGVLGLDQFHDELGLVAEQKERLVTLRKQIQQRRMEAYGDFKKLEPQKIATVARELEGKIQDDTRQQLSEILLPHQVERLRQIRFQLQMRNRGANALTGGDFAATLGLSEKQQADLVEKQREAEKQLREKVEEIRRQLLQDIVRDVLTQEQRDKLAKLVGDEIKVKPVELALPPRVKTPVTPDK